MLCFRVQFIWRLYGNLYVFNNISAISFCWFSNWFRGILKSSKPVIIAILWKKQAMVQIIYFMNSSVNAISDFANDCPAKCPLQMFIMNSRQSYERQVVTSWFTVQTSHFTVHTSQFTLPSFLKWLNIYREIRKTSKFRRHSSYVTVHTSHLTVHTSHFTLIVF